MNKELGIIIAIPLIVVLVLSFYKPSTESVSLTITGDTQVQPGQQKTYTINLPAPTLIDSDSTDGSYQSRWASWSLVDKDGKLLVPSQEGPWEQISNSYSKTITITIPQSLGKYSIIALIQQSDGTFSNGWIWSEYYDIAKEAYVITSIPSSPVPPPPRGWAFILGLISDWVRDIFK